jgi:hypothetical protein
VGGLVTGLKA